MTPRPKPKAAKEPVRRGPARYLKAYVDPEVRKKRKSLTNLHKVLR